MYQNSKWFTNHISYSKWLKLPFRPAAREYFPLFFKKQTGLELAPGWKDPPINSVTQTYINKMESIGFKPHRIVEDKCVLTGISLPLLTDRRSLGGFLAIYKPRRSQEFIGWVKYTHPELVGPETPLIAISGVFRSKPDGLLVDNLKDYFKLINWIYCQERTYAIPKFKKDKKKCLPLIIYVDQGESGVVEKLRLMQMHFAKLTDFSGRFVEEIKTKMKSKDKPFCTDVLQYFDENPLPYCYNRIQYEDAMTNLKSSFLRKTPLECLEKVD